MSLTAVMLTTAVCLALAVPANGQVVEDAVAAQTSGATRKAHKLFERAYKASGSSDLRAAEGLMQTSLALDKLKLATSVADDLDALVAALGDAAAGDASEVATSASSRALVTAAAVRLQEVVHLDARFTPAMQTVMLFPEGRGGWTETRRQALHSAVGFLQAAMDLDPARAQEVRPKLIETHLKLNDLTAAEAALQDYRSQPGSDAGLLAEYSCLLSGVSPTPEQIDSGAFVFPQAVSKAPPQMPAGTLDSKIGGVVQVHLLLDERGRVLCQALLVGGPAFAEEALRVTKLWRYRPATLDGKPVRYLMRVIVNMQFR